MRLFCRAASATVRARRPAIAAIVLLALLLAAGAPNGASAHARLTVAAPASGTALAAFPARFELTFSEPVDLTYSAATLRTALNEPVATASLATNDDRLTLYATLPDATSIPPGTYALLWRVLSIVDGHVTTGVIAFSVGTGIAPAAGASSSESRPPLWRIALRWGELAAFTLLLGHFAFPVLIARELAPQTGLRIGRGGWALAALLLLSGYDLGLIATGSRFLDPPGLDQYRDILLRSNAGRSWLLLCACAAIMIACATRPTPWLRFKAAGLAAALAALFALSYAGHAAATSHPWRSIAVDWMHLTTVGLWFGSLPLLWLALRPRNAGTTPDTLDTATRLVARFSTFGLFLMAAIIATGTLRATDGVAGPTALAGSGYGRVLIAKHLLLLPVLVAAGANLLVIVPRLRTARRLAVPAEIRAMLSSVRHFIGAEIVATLVILIMAGALTELAPADGPLTVDVAAAPSAINSRGSAGNLSVWLLGRIAGEPGDRYTISVEESDGAPVRDIQRLIVQTSFASGDAAAGDRFDAQPLSGSQGTFVFPALRLGLRGTWDLALIMRRAGVEDVTIPLQIDTSGAGPQPPRLVADQWRLPRVPVSAWLLLGCAVAVLIAGIVTVRRLPGVEPFAVAIILTMVVLITAGFAVQGYRRTIPVSAGSGLTNPRVDDPAAITRGEGLYATYCLQCHGPGGAGIAEDDPEHPHSGGSNLRDRATADRRDGDLYWAISYGLPGTDMPAFDVALSDAERWELVSYLRWLQDQ